MPILLRSRYQLITLMLTFQQCAWATEDNSTTTLWLSVLLPISLMIAGLLAVLVVAKRFGRTGTGGAGPLQVEQIVGVGQRERIVVLRDGDRCFAVGVGGQSVSYLTELKRSESAQ